MEVLIWANKWIKGHMMDKKINGSIQVSVIRMNKALKIRVFPYLSKTGKYLNRTL